MWRRQPSPIGPVSKTRDPLGGCLLAAALLTLQACERTPAPERHAPVGSALRTSCAGLGPAACERPPSTPVGLCQSLAGCVNDHSGNFNLSGMDLDCKREPFGAAPETAFMQRVLAPPGSGVRATSLVTIIASEDDAMRFGASYLVAELDEGLCIVDDVLPWGGSYADAEFATRWDVAPSAPARLHVRAQRTTFTVLDQAELESGESNVADEVCVQRSYEVAVGRFTRVDDQREAAGPCPRP